MIADCLNLEPLRKKQLCCWKDTEVKMLYWITHLHKDNTFKMLLLRIKTIFVKKEEKMPQNVTVLLYRHLVKKCTITLSLSQAPLVNTSLHGTLQLHRTVTSTKLILDWSILVIYAYHHHKQMRWRTHFVTARWKKIQEYRKQLPGSIFYLFFPHL